MSFITAAIIAGGATLASSYMGSRAATKAGETQAGAARDAAELQNEQYQQTRADQAPFRQGGLAAQNRLMTLLGIGGQAPSSGGGGGMFGSIAGLIGNAVNGQGINVDPNSPDYGKYARDFGMSDFQADPGYAFRLAEGQKALDRSAAARGGLISGGALKAAQRYGQDMGSQEYINAFNRYQTNRNNQLNPLQSLMGAGQTATNQVGTAGQSYATSAGNAMMGGAAAQAAGTVGQANAINSGLSTYLNYSQGNNLINALNNRGTTYSPQQISDANAWNVPTSAPAWSPAG